MNRELLDKANKLPLLPGVYIMHDARGEVIYVGKARKLKNRVSQYFQDSAAHSPKTRMMVSHIANFDYIIAMDYNNLRNMGRFVKYDTENKIHLLMSYTGNERSVSDPWYTRDFQTTWNDISEGCEALFRHILKEKKL